MHLPDGYLDTKTVLLSAGAAAAGVALAARHARTAIPPRRMPLIGLGAAFLFAAQMLNFPVAAGTSGHLLGGVLAAVLLGPSAAILALTCVLIIQCFVFADGGLTALGANIFNLAIVNAGGGYLVFLAARWLAGKRDLRSAVFAAVFAAWVATVGAAVCCAGQLAFSGTAPWRAVFPAMAGVHMLIGVIEALITGLVVMYAGRARPDLVHALAGRDEAAGGVALAGYGLLVALGLAMFVAPFASPWPDGLERAIRSLGLPLPALAPASAPLPDYQLPLLGSATAATALAGMAGTLMVFLAAGLLARALVPGLRRKPHGAAEP